MPKRIGFIINPAASAGRCPARWAEVQGSFPSVVAGREIRFTSRPGDAMRLAQEVGRTCDIVVAVGGDGTLLEVVSGLLLGGATDTHLGILPLGTGNDAARLCGISDIAQARLALQGTRTKDVDVVKICCQSNGEVVTRYALLYGGVGIIGEVLKQTTPLVKRIFGRRLAYVVGALRAIRSYRAPVMRVTSDGLTREQRFLLVSASNGELSGGGLRLAPDARMDDGVLDVNVCEAIGRWAAVALLGQMARGRRMVHPKLRYFPARTLAVHADPPLEVGADGELIGQTPVQMEVLPQALRILIP